MTDKISVIIPSYNSGRFIKECLRSITMQHGGFDIEILIIDNDSTDKTGLIVGDFKKFDCVCSDGYALDIDFIQAKDKGIMDAWNIGLELATGNFVAFCNTSERYFDCNWFNDCIQVMKDKSNWVSAVYGMTLKVEEKNNIFHGIGGNRVIPIFKNSQTPTDCLKAFIENAITWNECTAVLRTEVIKELSPFLINNFGSTLDAQRRFYEAGYLSYFLSKIGTVTLIHSDSGTNNHQSGADSNKMFQDHYDKIKIYANKILKDGEYCYSDYKGVGQNSILIKSDKR